MSANSVNRKKHRRGTNKASPHKKLTRDARMLKRAHERGEGRSQPIPTPRKPMRWR